MFSSAASPSPARTPSRGAGSGQGGEGGHCTLEMLDKVCLVEIPTVFLVKSLFKRNIFSMDSTNFFF